MAKSSEIGVFSEVGNLKKVLIHKPGEEIENITPELMERLLFDDIPYLRVAREEHDEFAKILKNSGSEVLYLIDSVAEILKEENVKREFITQYIAEAGIEGEGIKRRVEEMLYNISDLKVLVSKMVSGIYKKELEKPVILSFADIIKEPYPFVVDPMPNLYFTRDPAAVIGSGRAINQMRTVTRRRETIFTDYLFKYHESFGKGSVKPYYDRDFKDTIEGGDIIVLSDKLVAIGISERTDILAIEKLAKNIFEAGDGFETVLAFSIPDKRAFMHLDTVFTMIDRDAFTIHPEIEHVLKLYSINKTEDGVKYHVEGNNLQSVLKKYLALNEVRLIRCGDGDPITAAREQWNDGSNTLAVAPGEIVVYERNHVTNRILEEAGIKLNIMPSSELSRGRGGPRCMSMPLLRERL